MIRSALWGVATHIVAACIVAALLQLLPSTLSTTTTTLGYAVHQAFNIKRLILECYAWGVGWPLLGLSLWAIAGRKSHRSLRRSTVPLIGDLRSEGSNAPSHASPSPPPPTALIPSRLASWDVPLALLAPWLLFAGSHLAQIHIIGGTSQRLAWFRLEHAVACTAALAAWFAWKRRRSPGSSVASTAVPLLTIPAMVYLASINVHEVFSRPMDWFHDGETLAPAAWMLEGKLPWRDFVPIHGVLEDPLRSLIGFFLYGESFGGSQAGQAMIYIPLFGVALAWFAWAAGLGRMATLWFLVALPAALEEPFAWTHGRLSLVWIALAFVARGLDTSRPPLVAVGGAVAALSAVLCPETGLAAIAMGAGLGGAALLDRRWARAFAWLAGAGTLTGALSVLVLQAFGMLEGFWTYFRSFTVDHPMGAGIPVQVARTWPITFSLFTPFVAGWLCIWLGAVAWFRHRSVSGRHVLGLIVALFSFAYYQKFIDRADMHLTHAFCGSLPALVCLLASLNAFLAARSPAIGKIAGALVLVACLPALVSRVSALPSRLSTTLLPTDVARLGFGAPAFADLERARASAARDAATLLRAALRPGETFYDFTNQPGFFYFLLGAEPASRWYYPAIAFRRDAQDAVVADLQKSQPPLVAFRILFPTGVSSWDGISNVVRHSTISQYLVREYEPLGWFGGMFYIAKPDRAPALREALLQSEWALPATPTAEHLMAEPCDWGASPNFLEDRLMQGRNLIPVEANLDAVSPTRTILSTEKSTDTSWTREMFLELTFDTTQPEGIITIRAAESEIAFRWLPVGTRGSRVIPVGACPQWRAMRHSPLTVEHPRGVSLRGARLWH